MNAEPSRIRVLVVDDEVLARRNLLVLLGRDGEVEVVGECASGPEAVEAIGGLSPDLVFLDVQMPELDGFAVLEALGDTPLPTVVFVTAYDRYALKAFEVEALDYLLKPFDDERFNRTLHRAKQAIRQRHMQDLSQSLIAVVDRYRQQPAQSGPVYLNRIMVRSAGRLHFLEAGELDWIEAADYYACLHTAGRTHLLRRSMNDLERELDPASFARIHRSTIVNLSRVRELRLDPNGEAAALLRDGTSLRVSRAYRERLQAKLK